MKSENNLEELDMRFKVYLREVAEFQKGFAFKSKDYVDKGTKIANNLKTILK